MEYVIRHIKPHEWPLLEGFLYEAIFVLEGFVGEVPRSVIYDDPKCRAAFEGFGNRSDDRALVAVADGSIVGACWARTTDEYGHVDDETPSLSISLYKPYRGCGIGSALMRAMLSELRDVGFGRTSLSVQKLNPAVRLYERLGFRIVGNGADESEWLMICALGAPFRVIETDRLILRPWLESDALELFGLASDPDVGLAAGWPPHASEADSLRVIRTVLSAPETYAVVLKATGALVGCAGFNAGEAASMPLAEGELELGYWIGRRHWGCGYATEASNALVRHGFDALGLSGIHAAFYDGNDRSRAVLEKLGFTHTRVEHDVDCPLLDETRTAHFVYLDSTDWRCGT